MDPSVINQISVSVTVLPNTSPLLIPTTTTTTSNPTPAGESNTLQTAGASVRRNRSGAEKRRARKAKAVAKESLKEGPSADDQGHTVGGRAPKEVSRKRPSPVGETPPSAKKVVTRPKVPDLRPRNYAQAVNCDLKVAVVQGSYPDHFLSEEQSAAIQNGVVGALDKLPVGGFVPRFHETFLAEGALKVTCADIESREWLRNLLPGLTPWEGASLHLVERTALQKPTRVSLWLPGPIEEPKTALARLGKQNVGFEVDRWRIYDRKEEAPKGQLLILGVDAASRKALEAVDLRPFFGMTRAVVRLLGKPEKANEKQPNQQ